MKHIGILILSLLALPLSVCSCGGDSNAKHASLKEVVSAVARNVEQNQKSTKSAKQSTAASVDGLEIPAPLSGSGEIILKREGYTVSYNAKTMQPNWVAWHLTDKRTKGSTKRSDYGFTEDEDVPEPRAIDSDYRSSGYDRGHMCPAGDNKWKAEAMRQSFLFTNICPQAPSLNRGDWNEMEIACRSWAKEYKGLYVVCGPIFYKKSKHKTIGKHKIPVPEAFFKVVLREDCSKAIGFIYKNDDGNRPKGDYVNTVDEVERVTGIDFFPSLPDNVEKQVEAKCSLDDWE